MNMEENMNTTGQTQAGNVGDQEVQGAVGKEEKLFTQEEVNSFVQSRISRMKTQAAKDAKAEYDQRMADLQAREMKLLVKERLHDRGMPKELADVITCADEADINSKLDALQKIYGGNAGKEEKPTGFVRVGTVGGPSGASGPDPVRKAMGLN